MCLRAHKQPCLPLPNFMPIAQPREFPPEAEVPTPPHSCGPLLKAQRSSQRTRGSAEAQPWPPSTSSHNVSSPRRAATPQALASPRQRAPAVPRETEPGRCLIRPPAGHRGAALPGRAQAKPTPRGPGAALGPGQGRQTQPPPRAAPQRRRSRPEPRTPLHAGRPHRNQTRPTHPLVEDRLHVYCQPPAASAPRDLPSQSTFPLPDDPLRPIPTDPQLGWAWRPWQRPLLVGRPAAAPRGGPARQTSTYRPFVSYYWREFENNLRVQHPPSSATSLRVLSPARPVSLPLPPPPLRTSRQRKPGKKLIQVQWKTQATVDHILWLHEAFFWRLVHTWAMQTWISHHTDH